MSNPLPLDEVYRRIQRNWELVSSEVSDAANAIGGTRDSVRIVGVSKYVDIAWTKGLIEAGCRNLGESRPQALWEKHAQIADPNVKWHLIGHLQRNKIKKTLPCVDCIESVDSLRLLQQLEQDAKALDRRVQVLFEVNATNGRSKTGAAVDEVREMAQFAAGCQWIHVAGMMGMSTLGAPSDQARREFASIRELRDRLQSEYSSGIDLKELSMGMSGDFRDAIAEGATIVRIGSALFRDLQP